MPDRYKLDRSNRQRKQKPSRKKAKKAFMRVKNRTAGKTLGHRGVYCSYHVHEEFMSWIDVYFPSKFHRGRYFSAALITCEMRGYDDDESAAWKEAEATYPDATSDLVNGKRFKDGSVEVRIVGRNGWDEMLKIQRDLTKELNKKPRPVKPSIIIDRNYWYPAIGLHGVVNTPSLTEDAIIEFIEMFQSLGEPITPGIVWEGPEVEVVPAKMDERYAQSRSHK
jgi:hypothetical protein